MYRLQEPLLYTISRRLLVLDGYRDDAQREPPGCFGGRRGDRLEGVVGHMEYSLRPGCRAYRARGRLHIRRIAHLPVGHLPHSQPNLNRDGPPERGFRESPFYELRGIAKGKIRAWRRDG